MSGLRKFKRHTLYTNIANDRSAVYYTTGITKTDPFTNMDNVKVNYLDGYEGVILDPKSPVAPRPKSISPASLSKVTASTVKWFKRMPFMLAVTIFVPIGVVAFLINSIIQTVRSSNRIKLHEAGQAGLNVQEYRMPVRIEEIREEVEQAYEALNNAQGQDYLATEDEDDEQDVEIRKVLTRERRLSTPAQPTLALTAEQFEMIENLDALGWRKYPVWIHNHRHSHAAIIVRIEKKSFDEGWVILKHFAGEEFLI